ncbi:MAG: hypothetical protein U0931_13415 [Vulcanimicrobiota bacterium]
MSLPATNIFVGGGSNNGDSVQFSPELARVTDAEATTGRRDRSLALLGQSKIGPIILNGSPIERVDGYKAISDASWDRVQSAYNGLPDSAKASIHDQLAVVKGDWIKSKETEKEPNAGIDSYNELSPGFQQEYEWMWMAQAAGNYARSSGAQGSPSDLVNLADGSRQYLQARMGYLEQGGKPGGW